MFREKQNKKIVSCCCSRAQARMKGEEEKGKKGRYKWEECGPLAKQGGEEGEAKSLQEGREVLTPSLPNPPPPGSELNVFVVWTAAI